MLLTGCKQRNLNFSHTVHRPKLVVGIVVDQMRWDFLYRYYSKYSGNGFQRLLREGYSCENTHLNYIPTYTGPGHACIYTGSVPAIDGIAANDWYVRERKTDTYCVEDSTCSLVGVGKIKGNISPANLLTTTITDELRLATNLQSKVIAVALKDRSSVLPGGHIANAAYFMDYSASNFVSSSYYMKELPQWVTDFNNKKLVQKYLSQDWSTLLPLNQYTESTADDVAFEQAMTGEEKPVFVHRTSEIGKSKPEVIVATPFGNSITLDFARAAIEGENLGNGKSTDFLAVSLSSTDYIGHEFGPNSVEIEDCYLRLDKDLGRFLTYLDEKIGAGNYLLFLTADHGAAHATGFMKEHNIPAGSFLEPDSTKKILNKLLQEKFGAGEWISAYENMQVYLNDELVAEKKVDRKAIFNLIKSTLMKQDAVANVIDMQEIATSDLQDNLKGIVANGYNAKRSGDFYVLFNPGWLEGYTKGTSHGAPYPYDTHIPLLWYGWNIRHGENHTEVHMTDISPTLAALLHIQEPDGNVGRVISNFAK